MSETPNINLTFGVAFMGLVVGSVLYGTTCMQTYLYYRLYPKDILTLKFIVFTLWVLDTSHMVLSIATIYWYLISNFNNVANLDIGYWAMDLQVDFNGLIALIVELFFAVRVWKVSKSRWLTGFISILSVVHFSLGIYFTIEGFHLGHFSRYSKLEWATCLGLGSAAACDVVIAVSLVYYLSRSRTGFKRSDSIISTLVLYAINTGLFTSICASTAAISFGLMPTSFVYLAFFWCLGKLYVISLLASLNSRQALRKLTEEQETPASLNLTDFRNNTSSQSARHAKVQFLPNNLQSIPGPFSPIAIVVDTMKEQSSDYDTMRGTNSTTHTSNKRSLPVISEHESFSDSVWSGVQPDNSLAVEQIWST